VVLTHVAKERCFKFLTDFRMFDLGVLADFRMFKAYIAKQRGLYFQTDFPQFGIVKVQYSEPVVG
jgi:hypothetical protein